MYLSFDFEFLVSPSCVPNCMPTPLLIALAQKCSGIQQTWVCILACHFIRVAHIVRCIVSLWALNPCSVSYTNAISKYTEYPFKYTFHNIRFCIFCTMKPVLICCHSSIACSNVSPIQTNLPPYILCSLRALFISEF